MNRINGLPGYWFVDDGCRNNIDNEKYILL